METTPFITKDYYVRIYCDYYTFLTIDRAALVSFLLFRFNRRSGVHGSPVGGKQRPGIRHFRHQRHSVFANSANASCRPPGRYVAASGFGGLHTPSGITNISRPLYFIQKQTLAMILTQAHVDVRALANGNLLLINFIH